MTNQQGVNAHGVDPAGLRLGKQRAVHDPRTARLENFLVPAEVEAHPSANKYSGLVSNWQVLGNDQYGDCVFAGAAHQQMAVSAAAGTPWQPSVQAIIAQYLALSGGDHGLVILDFLRWWRKNSTAIGKPILGFAAVNWRDHDLSGWAAWRFYGLLRGILMPLSAQAQTGPTGMWNVTGLTGPGTPGSWGGHLTYSADYDPAHSGEVTWGFVQPATLAFMDAYCDEAYVVIPTYPVPGFDYNKFVQYIKDIGGFSDFDPPLPDPNPPTPPAPDPTDINVLIRQKLGVVSGVDVRFSKGAVWPLAIQAPPA